MKIQKYPCVKVIELFYSMITLVILLCIKNTIIKINSHNPQKTSVLY